MSEPNQLRESHILVSLEDYINEHGYSPPLREIGKANVP